MELIPLSMMNTSKEITNYGGNVMEKEIFKPSLYGDEDGDDQEFDDRDDDDQDNVGDDGDSED